MVIQLLPEVGKGETLPNWFWKVSITFIPKTDEDTPNEKTMDQFPSWT
jgi:hypothetical protein